MSPRVHVYVTTDVSPREQLVKAWYLLQKENYFGTLNKLESFLDITLMP